MFFHSCKDRDFVFVQGNLAKSWGCVDFSFYYFSLGSHLINTMKGFNYCKREKLFLKTQVGIDKSSMLNYIPLSGKKSFIGAICVDSLVQGFPREQNHLDVCHNLMQSSKRAFAALCATLNRETVIKVHFKLAYSTSTVLDLFMCNLLYYVVKFS